MGSNSKNPKFLLDQIAEFMAEEAEEMSDQELLEEAGEAARSVGLHVEKLKRTLGERTASARREQAAEWLSELPLKDMIKFGWLKLSSPSLDEKVSACLHFFDTPDVTAWRDRYRDVLEKAAFRTSPSFDSQPGAVAAWLRQGEIESGHIICKPWDSQRFQRELLNIRSLTRKKDPKHFVPELKARCAECGVAVVIVRAPTGCRASGATRFLSQTKSLLLLSFRYLSDDHFWFTFFHEGGHLVLHGKSALFLEAANMASTKEEQEANEFATRVLIPPEYQTELFRLRLDSYQVIRFARRIGISPGIVAGQLQYAGRIERNHLNHLKRRFKWAVKD